MKEDKFFTGRRVVIGIPIILAFVFFYIFFIMPKMAEKRIQAFCDQIDIGMQQEKVTEKVIESDLKFKVYPPKTISIDDPQTTIRVSDAVTFDRYFCTLKILNGLVDTKKTSHVD
jgi:hypothetical protein